MTVELLQTLSLVSFIVAGILFLAGVALFFLLDVPKLYGDVSGRTAKKAIEAIRRQNESSGDKAYKSSSVNMARGKLTDKISKSGNLVVSENGQGLSVGTEKLSTATLALQSSETTVLYEPANETTILNENFSAEEETSVLIQETDIITEQADSGFTVDVEMGFTESSEIIE